MGCKGSDFTVTTLYVRCLTCARASLNFGILTALFFSHLKELLPVTFVYGKRHILHPCLMNKWLEKLEFIGTDTACCTLYTLCFTVPLKV